jgi:Arc/MetJ-type ribon-helix-helix transcriptional regulator
MKDDRLTVRLPSELARALARHCADRDTPLSSLVREAVARYLEPATEKTPALRVVTAAELAARWPASSRLSPAEAVRLGTDIAEARKTVRKPN